MKYGIITIAVISIVLGLLLFVFNPDDIPKHTNKEVQSYQLPNGLKVLVMENHRAPVVVSQIWYKVGASYEHDGITGISHVLEHMMFKGTPDYPAGKFSEIIAANGGRENAFTGEDYTAYFQQIANNRLALCFKLEADRMHNLTLNKDDFKKELQVVKEERRMRTDDKPTALTYERFNAVAFTNNPYHHPVIGWEEDLNSLTVKDVRKWYKTWYAPNNATLVVVGDVDAGKVFHLAKKYFGPIPSRDVPRLKPRHGVKQYGTKRLTVRLPARVPYLVMGYKVPVLRNVKNKQDAYALEVLAGLLDGGNSARLSKNLVRGQQVAASASAGYSMTTLHNGLFTLSAIPDDGVSVKKLELALRQQVSAIQTTPPGQKELERVKAEVVASNVYKQDSTFYQAMEIGMLETVGLSWRVKDEYVKNIQAITAREVQQVAKKYLVNTGLTVAVLDPLPIKSGSRLSTPTNPARQLMGGLRAR